MKRINRVVFIISLLMILPLLFWYINSFWFIEPVEKRNLTENQINEICDQFKIDINPDEVLSVEYFPGVMQATTYLKVYIENIKSEEDFLSRFKGAVIDKTENDVYFDKNVISIYNVEIFTLTHTPKDYSCSLSFIQNESKMICKFHISGYIPQLDRVYSFMNDPLQPLLDNYYFMTFAIIEVLLLLYLIFQAILKFIIKKRCSKVVVH